MVRSTRMAPSPEEQPTPILTSHKFLLRLPRMGMSVGNSSRYLKAGMLWLGLTLLVLSCAVWLTSWRSGTEVSMVMYS